MDGISLSMAIADFVPVILFAISVAVLQKEFYFKMQRVTFSLFSAGTISIIFAGGLKALHKLLLALSICDFKALSSLFMPLQSIGFMLSGIALVMMVAKNKDNKSLLAVTTPAVFNGTMIFVGFMVTGIGLMSGALSIYAKREKKYMAIVLFVLTFICLLCMGYLSNKDFSKALFNWLAEIINIAGQACLLCGSLLIRKSESDN